MKNIILLTVFLGFFKVSLAQTPGSLDSSFNGNGILKFQIGSASSGIVDAYKINDSTLYALGVAGVTTFITKISDNGSPDLTFGNNGYLIIPKVNVAALKVLTNNKFIVAFNNSGSNISIHKFNANGSIDSTFNQVGYNTFGMSEVSFMNILSNGKILISGKIDNPTPNSQWFYSGFLRRLNSDGSIDSTFGVNGISTYSPYTTSTRMLEFTELPNGNLISRFKTWDPSNNIFHHGIGNLNSNGTLLNPFNYPFSYRIRSDIKFFYHKNNLYIVKHSTNSYFHNFNNNFPASNAGISKYNLSSNIPTIDSSFGINGHKDISIHNPFYINSLYFDDNGKILLSGSSSDPLSSATFTYIMRLDSLGNIDYNFGVNGNHTKVDFSSWMSSSNAIFKMRYGKILSLGTASSFTSNSIAIVRFSGDGSVPSEIPFNSQPNNSLNIYPNPTSNILHIDAESKIESISISDMTGKKIQTFENIINNEISIESLQKGIYLLVCRTKNGNFNTKIIKTDN
jgi:uncharacterized delta-60 repeat protein